MSSDLALPPAARPGTGQPGTSTTAVRRVARSLVRTAARLLGVVVLVVAPACTTVAGSAGAATVASTQAQIGAVESRIVATASRVHQLTSAYDTATVTASTLGQQLTQDRSALAAATEAVGAGRHQLTQAAIDAYTGDPTSGTTTSDPLDPGVGSAYLQVAVGSVSDTIDSYQEEQRQLTVSTAAVAGDAAAAARAAAQVDADRQAAVAVASSAQTQLAGLEAQLTSLQAAQAAHAAQIAATSAEAGLVAGPASAPGVPPDPPAPTQGGPVMGGLVRAVTQVVTPTTTVAAPVAPGPTSAPAPSEGAWLELRQCESGDDYGADTGNGYYGAYQFSSATWTDLGYPGRPDHEPPAMQDQAAMRLQAASGWGQWPACAAALGLR